MTKATFFLTTTLSICASLVISTNNYGLGIVAEAATPMPTNVNVTNLTDAEVSAYYGTISGQTGDALLAALNQIIKDHNEYNYDSDTHRTIYKIIDRNWTLSPASEANLTNYDYANGNPFIKKLYADYNDDLATADRFKNAGATRVSFDKEHIWAQSLGNFGRTGGAGSDFHALWPADVKGNQQAHSNYNFAMPTSNITNVNNDKGTYVGRNGNISGSSQKVFEPLDEYKGDIARAMFYMPARYYTYENALHPKLTLVNGSPSAITASVNQPGLAGDLATLLAWHISDPVDEYEIHRNNLIANNYQGNRNPFIDYPQWAAIAYDTSFVGTGALPTLESSSVGSGEDEPVEAITTLTSIEVTLAHPNQVYYLFDQLTKEDFIVTAYYSDNSHVVITDYEWTSGSDAQNRALSSYGPNVLTFTYTDENIIKEVSIVINATLSTGQIIILGAITLIVMVVLVAVPTIRKKTIKKAKTKTSKLIRRVNKNK